MIGTELPGEDSFELTWESQQKQKLKPGRPREIDRDALELAVNALEFVLEENWGEVGWLLREAKSMSDVRNAFAKIVHQRCRYLEPFTDDQTLKTTPTELRRLRKKLVELRERHGRNNARSQTAQRALNEASSACASESDPVKQGQIRAILSRRTKESQEANSLEQTSRFELESLCTQIRESEAYFARTEILRFLQSDRRQFTPLNVAFAMAGLPHITARVSCERCAEYGIKPTYGLAFEIFQTIERQVPDPVLDLGRSIDALREFLLYGPQCNLVHAVRLRKNWHFLEKAIRSAASDTGAPSDSLAFRIFAEYTRSTGSSSIAEWVIAEANCLRKGDEDSEL